MVHQYLLELCSGIATTQEDIQTVLLQTIEQLNI